MKLDRNQFLLLATAIGAGVMGTAAKSYDPPVSTLSKGDDAEQDQAAARATATPARPAARSTAPSKKAATKGASTGARATTRT